VEVCVKIGKAVEVVRDLTNQNVHGFSHKSPSNFHTASLKCAF
jgi:hypothetical protein